MKNMPTLFIIFLLVLQFSGCLHESNSTTSTKATDITTPLQNEYAPPSSNTDLSSSIPTYGEPFSGIEVAPEIPSSDESNQIDTVGQFVLQILDVDGNPVNNAHLEMFDVPRDSQPISQWSNSKGEVKLNWPKAGFVPVQIGDYNITITIKTLENKEITEQKLLSITKYDTSVLTVQLNSKYLPPSLDSIENGIEIFIHNEDLEPLPDVWLSIFLSGAGWPDSSISPRPHGAYTDSEGKAIFADINDGNYTLTMGEGGQHVFQSEEITVDAANRKWTILCNK